jgi:hypothetical protein
MNTRASWRSPKNVSNFDPPMSPTSTPPAWSASTTSRSQARTGNVAGSRLMPVGLETAGAGDEATAAAGPEGAQQIRTSAKTSRVRIAHMYTAA